jgi:rhamnogalacturonan endolyase
MLPLPVLGQNEKLIFEDNFSKSISPKRWKIEMENLPKSSVITQDSALFLDTKGGITLWLRKKLKGNYKITYLRTVIMNNGINDRLSDMNQFWLAGSGKKDFFSNRTGKFEEYDSLKLYYVGMGGNYNTTTRFRKYQGNGEKTLLSEKNDSLHLLKPNLEYKITIIVQDKTTSFWIDEQCIFSQTDSGLLQEGYFGFRSTFSHQKIRRFKIYRLTKKY